MESINKTPYTPGPWALCDYNRCAIQSNDGVQVAMATYVPTQTQIQKTKVNGAYYVGNGTTALANAALICAAPELLEKLEQFITLSENNSITYKELEEARKLIFRIKNG